MKTPLLFSFIVLGLATAFKSADANATIPSAASGKSTANYISANSKRSAANLSATGDQLEGVTQLLRLKLVIDQYNYDDIVIGFNAGTSTTYNPNEDSRYLPGINAAEGLASYSSDGVPCAINFLPLPKQTAEVIRLDVEARQSGIFTLERTELTALPKIYDVWLMDDYKKDSLQINDYPNYMFSVDKNDTASFGSYRFRVVIRQNPAMYVHLLNFTAAKVFGGGQIAWTTENEESYTHFAVERSSDGGSSYSDLDTLTSDSAGTYSYLDNAPPVAEDRYRLKITDFNGVVTYSDVATLMYATNTGTTVAESNINVYPNPVSSVINLSIKAISNNVAVTFPLQQTNGLTTFSTTNTTSTASASYDIKIINITGSVIKMATSSDAAWQDNVSNLSPGTYIISVTNNADKSLVGRKTFVKM